MTRHHLTGAALLLLLAACQPTGDGQGAGGLDDDLGAAEDAQGDAQDDAPRDQGADADPADLSPDLTPADMPDLLADLTADLDPDLPPEEDLPLDLACNLTCPAPEPRCDGDLAVSYAGDGRVTDACECDYEDVRARQDCAALGQTCQEGLCVGEPGRCAQVTCPAPAPACQGAVALRYRGDGACDPDDGQCGYDGVEVRQDCAALGQACRDGACLDLCEGVRCDAPAPSCQGSVAISYDGPLCDPQRGVCDPARVRQARDCAALGQVCLQGTCGAPQDPCLGVSCPALADFCQGEQAVRFLRAGACEDGDCDYSGATAQEDCAARGARCVDGACVGAPARAPRPGELFVVEVMRNPEAVSDDMGEWFELYNSADAPLLLGDLTWTDGGSNRFTIPAALGVTIAPQQRLILGNNPNRLTNGGVEVDYAYTDSNFVLANGADRIILLNGQAELTRLDWTTAWPAPTGASIQFDASSPLSLLDDMERWCPSRALLPDGDRGTPGQPNQPCALPTQDATVQLLSDEGAPNRPEVFTPVRLQGLVVTAAANDGQRRYAWAQDPAGGPHSGIRLDLTGSGISLPARGALIQVEGLYEEFFTVAQLRVERLTVVGSAAPPAPHDTTPAALTNLAEAERRENTLVRLTNLTVTNDNPDFPEDFGEFVVNNTTRVDDMIYRLPVSAQVGTRFSSLTGVWSHSFDNYKLEPRDALDVQGQSGP